MLPPAGRPYALSAGADVHIAVDGPHTCDMASFRFNLNLVTLETKRR